MAQNALFAHVISSNPPKSVSQMMATGPEEQSLHSVPGFQENVSQDVSIQKIVCLEANTMNLPRSC